MLQYEIVFRRNISPKLVKKLADLYPDSKHTESAGLSHASDRDVWSYAAQNDYLIVTKDADFNELIILLGSPPKIIWIRRGNCFTTTIKNILRQNYSAIKDLAEKPDLGTLILF